MRQLIACSEGNFNPTMSWIDGAVDKAKRCKCNAISFFTMSGVALYRSDILPRATIVTQDYDPLEYSIKAAHNAGLTISAWYCVGLMESSSGFRSRYAAHPDWDLNHVLPNLDHWWNFQAPGTVEFTQSVVAELVGRYPDLDTVLLDTSRYRDDMRPYPQFVAAPVTQAVMAMAKVVNNAGMKIGSYVLSGWGGDTYRLQNWRTDWALDLYVPMCYTTSRRALEHFIMDWQVTRYTNIKPAFSFWDYGNKVEKTPEQLESDIAFVRAAGFGQTEYGLFEERTATDEWIKFSANLAPDEPPPVDVTSEIARLKATNSELRSISAGIQNQINAIDSVIADLEKI